MQAYIPESLSSDDYWELLYYPASLTDLNVVYTIILNVKKILSNLEQLYSLLTIDKAIYQPAKQIQWNVPFLQDITLRLRGFHRSKNFLGYWKTNEIDCLRKILKTTEMYGQTQIEGNTKLIVLKFAVKILERNLYNKWNWS